MAAPKGNQFAWGNSGGGRYSKTEQRVRQKIIDGFWKQANRRRDKILEKYFSAKDAPRDIINRIIPYAKQEIQVNATHTVIDRKQLVVLMLTPEGREAAELITKALLDQQRQEPIALPPTNGTGHE